MPFDCAGSRKRVAHSLGAAFLLSILASTGSCDMPMCISRAHTEILPRDLFYRGLCRDLAKRPLVEILFRDLAERSLVEILPTKLLWRSCTLAGRPPIKILYSDLVKRAEVLRSCTETLHRDLLQRSCQEVSCINLAKGAFTESLPQRSHKEILPRDLF